MPIWPIHLKPLSGELLSSWMTRLSIANHLDTNTYFRRIHPSSNTPPTDIDRRYDSELIQALAEGTGISVEDALSTALFSEEGYVYTWRSSGASEWVFPTSNIDGHFSKGLAYCPECYATDQYPFYRKSWRFTFNPICPAHRLLMNQRCHDCGAPIDYYHLSLSDARAISHCTACDADLTKAPRIVLSDEITPRVISIQERLRYGINRDAFEIPGFGLAHALPYMRVLHTCMHSLMDPYRVQWVNKKYPKELPQRIAITEINPFLESRLLEHRSMEDIASLLCIADVLMRNWPARFMNYAHEFGLRRTHLLSRDTPYWVLATAKDPYLLGSYTTADSELAGARNSLGKQLGYRPSDAELKIYMADGTVRKLTKISKTKQRFVTLSAKHFALTPTETDQKVKLGKADDVRKLMSLTSDELAKYATLRKAKRAPEKHLEAKQFSLFGDISTDRKKD